MRRIHILVTPRASRNEIKEQADGSWKVRLAAPPVDGAANEALIAFLSEAWDIPSSAIRIIRGQRGRRKIVEIA